MLKSIGQIVPFPLLFGYTVLVPNYIGVRRKDYGMNDIVCIGMALVDSIIREFNPVPVSASGYLAESASLNVGGEAVNEAMAAAKLGMKTAILCALGPDHAGELVLRALEKSGVDARVLESPATPITTLFVRADGTRKSITNQAHRYNFHPEKNPSLFADARAVILGSLFRAPFDDPDIIHSVLHCAKETGKLVFADTKLPNYHFLSLENLRDSLPLVDCITPNEDEARYFTEKKDPEAMADVFLSFGVKQVIIKLGSRGCLLKSEKEVLRLPAHRIKAVDATGAGDNFLAGFVSEILRGGTSEEALRFANACGAVCTTAVGASSALKSREQILSFLRSPDRL